MSDRQDQAAPAPATATMGTGASGVLLLYLGGPDRPEAIRPFLVNLFSDRQIIRLPGGGWLQRLLARFIARRRAPQVAARYRELGSFPLLSACRAQARALEVELARRHPGRQHRVLLGMRYSPPSVEEALLELNERGIRTVAVLSLYPQYSMTTTGSSLRQLHELILQLHLDMQLRVVDRFSAHPAYIDLLAAYLEEGLQLWPAEQQRAVAVICTAHSVPLSFVAEGDPYPAEVEALRSALAARLARRPGGAPELHLGYQSRSGPVHWQGPELTEVAGRLLAAGRRHLLLVPLSFVSDHLETLHELDLVLRRQLAAAGAQRVERVRSFNDDPRFIGLLADLADHALGRSVPPAAGGDPQKPRF